MQAASFISMNPDHSSFVCMHVYQLPLHVRSAACCSRLQVLTMCYILCTSTYMHTNMMSMQAMYRTYMHTITHSHT